MSNVLEIKCRFTGKVLFSAVALTIAELLTAAVQQGANLYGADLRSADLRSANLRSVDLRSADLRSANLYGANLRSVDLRSADLYGANLYGADLRSADLRSANLRSVDLRSANLYGADLRSANLYGADIYGANLKDAECSELAIAQTRILPEGSIIGYKKCNNNVIVKLRIPEEAKRSHAFGRKCRAEYVVVLEVVGAEYGISKHDSVTKYVVGETVHCDKWGENWMEECSGGIHFFLTRIEAENY